MGIRKERYKEWTAPDGSKVGDYSGGDFVENYKRIVEKDTQNRTVWIKKLRDFGIKMAHPNDGWNDRKKREFGASYPYFDDGVEVGDLVALGDYNESTVFIKVEEINKSMFGRTKYYKYKDYK